MQQSLQLLLLVIVKIALQSTKCKHFSILIDSKLNTFITLAFNGFEHFGMQFCDKFDNNKIKNNRTEIIRLFVVIWFFDWF